MVSPRAMTLRGIATAALDVSDGLIADVIHMEEASGVAIQIDLIEADDAHLPLSAGGLVPYRGSEEDLPRGAVTSRCFRIHHVRGIDSLREIVDAPINLTQPPLVVLIVGVPAAIPIARGPGHHVCHSRPFPDEQEPQLVFEPLQPAWCDVVLDVVTRSLRKRHVD